MVSNIRSKIGGRNPATPDATAQAVVPFHPKSGGERGGLEGKGETFPLQYSGFSHMALYQHNVDFLWGFGGEGGEAAETPIST